MCDTIVVTADATAEGATLFGKNSDREPNEAHHLMRIPASDHAQPSNVKCTHIEIPQVAHTHEVLLAKPFWMWGAEMGANEHGVVIGNEAVFTRLPYQKEGGLLGMDLLRLALERSHSSKAAVMVITDLLGQYGQGGNCGFTSQFYYHNSFLIADPHSAWLLETAGPHWAAKQIHGIYSISNGLTIQQDFDLSSPGLVDYALTRRWCKNESTFSFAACYSDKIMSRLSNCEHRRNRSATNLNNRTDITVADIMSALRDHGDGDDPRKGLTKSNVCMHAGAGRMRRSQTTGSMVSNLAASNPTHFVTGTAAPCTSLFKPIWTGIPLPDTGPAPEGTFNRDNLYWQHEKLHRLMLMDLPEHLKQFANTRDNFEAQMISAALSHSSRDDANRHAVTQQYFEQSQELEAHILKQGASGKTDTRPMMYKKRWQQINRTAVMPEIGHA
jgi:secernin